MNSLYFGEQRDAARILGRGPLLTTPAPVTAASVNDIRQLAQRCVEAISKTLITETSDVILPDFKLDEFQQQLIDSTNRFVRVVAPAGSGKTRTLTAKALQLLGTDPTARILCLTFTNAAADELNNRFQAGSGDSRNRIRVATLNTFGYEIIRKFVPHHTLVSRGSYAFGGAYNIVKRVLELHPLSRRYQSYSDIIELADRTKSCGFGPTDTPETASVRYQALEHLKMSRVLEEPMHDLKLLPRDANRSSKSSARQVFIDKWMPFWKRLVQSLWEAGIITLEDQKYWSFCLLAGDARAQAWIRSQGLTHVMVDEFQDINYLDVYLVSQLILLSKAALFIVGDDDQCIYEWRGCTSDFIREPERYLAFLDQKVAFETILLERNYRCPRNVIEHASRLIAHNQARIAKRITPVRSDEANIRVISLPAAYLTIHVVDELAAAMTNQHPDHSIAILGRKKCQLVPLQILFTRRGMKFYVDEDLNVFLGDAFGELRQLLEQLSATHARSTPAQVVHDFFFLLHRLARHRLSNYEKSEIDDYLSLKRPGTLRECVDHFSRYPGEFKRGFIQPARAAEKLTEYLQCRSVVQALHVASTTFKAFARDFIKSREDIFYSDPPFGYLADLAVDYDDDFDSFLLDLDRTRREAEAHSAPGAGKVELLTALRGKGREFDTVIILDVNDGIWPNGESLKDGLVEEERRLFYVAISRTKANLLLFESGRVDGKRLDPSPYLAEMELPPSAWLKHPDIPRLSDQLLTTLRI